MREKRLRVVFRPAAVRDVEGLDLAAAIPLVKDIQAYLETRPIPIGKSRIKKLSGFDPPLHRRRSGDFRTYYRICGDEVVILAVTRRKDSDKRLKRISEEKKQRYRRPLRAGFGTFSGRRRKQIRRNSSANSFQTSGTRCPREKNQEELPATGSTP